MTETDHESWPNPVPLGSRLCWRWQGRNVTIPIVDRRSVYTDQRQDDPENGWNADLPTENGCTISVLWDPTGNDPPGTPPVSIWLYVRHPEYGHLIGARIGRSNDAAYWIEYDPACLGPACEDCQHDNDSWWEYVTDGPQHVLERLAWIGSLPIKALTR